MRHTEYQFSCGVVTFKAIVEVPLPGGALFAPVTVITEPDSPDDRLVVREVRMINQDITGKCPPPVLAALCLMAEEWRDAYLMDNPPDFDDDEWPALRVVNG